MRIESDIQTVSRIINNWKKEQLSVCLVPTMGFFHQGHLALMEHGRKIADKLVVSLFVNPAQFSPNEDLDQYPRDFDGDALKARNTGVDLLFCPQKSDVYVGGHQTTVSVGQLTRGLCGADRPEHFSGVTTIVTKLFNIVQPHFAVFGEKDYQQLAVIKQMVRDLNFPVEIVGYPIVRETDGLAMSSRNTYLDSKERETAVILQKALLHVKAEAESKGPDTKVAEILQTATEMIINTGICSVDYLSVVDSDTLEKKTVFSGKCRIAGAIRVNNKIRLIDNIAVDF